MDPYDTPAQLSYLLGCWTRFVRVVRLAIYTAGTCLGLYGLACLISHLLA